MTKTYQRILVALDFSPVSGQVVDRAKQMRDAHQAQLLLLHVVDYIPPLDPAGDLLVTPVWDVDEKELVDLAKGQFESLVKQKGLSECPREVMIGKPRTDIVEFARQESCDLIIIGSHGRHGIGRLLGSTVDAVLHKAYCDVLAVRADDR